MTGINLTENYPDTPEYRFAAWLSSQPREYIEWFEEEHRKSMEAEKKRESDGHGHIICTACKEANVSTWKSRFCPMCGADMREPKGEKGTE